MRDWIDSIRVRRRCGLCGRVSKLGEMGFRGRELDEQDVKTREFNV